MSDNELDNEYTYNTSMTVEEKIIFLKTLSVLAKADQVFDENEKEKIYDTAMLFGIPADKVPEILEANSPKEIIQEVAKIKNRRCALALIREACFLANADDDLTDDEILLIGQIGKAMGISPEKIEQISTWVINYIFLEKQKKIIFEIR